MPTARPLRRRAAVVAASIVLATSACTAELPDAAGADTTPYVPTVLEPAPPPFRISGCIDDSGSVEQAARLAVPEAFADFVQTWPLPEDGEPTPEAVVGLDLRLRRVAGIDAETGTGDPGAGSAAEVVRVEIPSSAALPPAPSTDDPHLVEATADHQRHADALRARIGEALVARSEGAEAIRSADLTATASDVVACLEGAANAQEAGPIVAFSDLLQRGEQGDAVAFTDPDALVGRHVLLVVGCATSGPCGANADAWEAALGAVGAVVERSSPERLRDDLALLAADDATS